MSKLCCFAVLCLALSAMAAPGTPDELESQWQRFKIDFNRQYRTPEEEAHRRQAFVANLELIRIQNERYEQGLSSYTLAINDFADWTNEEFIQRRLSPVKPKLTVTENQQPAQSSVSVSGLPAEVDWTKKGVVTPVLNMGDCGDGYAFGPVEALESAWALKTGKLVPLSVQQVVDCSGDEENNQCEGGLIDNSFEYIVKFGGIDTAESYPYVGPNSYCQELKPNKTIGARMKSYVDLPRFDEDSLQKAVATIGPVAISLDASSPHFMLYHSGVYDHTDCNMILINHGMCVVGYGTLNGKQYWKVKNSMGTKWGVDGYLLIARNKDNQCGIASTPSYPVV